MYLSTLDKLRCPRDGCRSPLRSRATPDGVELLYGELVCTAGSHVFPVLEGVAVIVPDPAGYLRRNADTIRRHVDRSLLGSETAAILAQQGPERRDQWSLDSEFAIGTYVANHYLQDGQEEQLAGHTDSPLVLRLIRDLWRDNTMTRLEALFARWKLEEATLLDLGCNVGGAVNRLGRYAKFSLGIDMSFSAVAYARRILRGSPLRLPIPADRLHGAVSKEAEIRWTGPPPGRADFVVGDATMPPVGDREWDVVLALGVLDIVKEPLLFLRRQGRLVSTGGHLAQSSPYMWKEESAETIRSAVPAGIRSSSEAVQWLYEREGFEIVERQDDIPWAFFKFDRRIEISAIHLLVGRFRPGGAP